ncbi:hypothetical protein C8Q76DRAFT_801300 [Earliella scabrosa]|nr:hypothetical protein C8Q76DRAFT_801300 [Earliella scabrosa]
MTSKSPSPESSPQELPSSESSIESSPPPNKPSYRNPYSIHNRHPDDEYIFELEPNASQAPSVGDELIRYTERAKRVQAAKWQRMLKIFTPRETIKEWFILSERNRYVHLAYGWAYKEGYLRKYAELMKLQVDLRESPTLARRLQKNHVVYGELSDEEQNCAEVQELLRLCARPIVLHHLREKTGIRLEEVRPFSDEHQGMFALYNNHNVLERFDAIDNAVGIDHVVDVMDEAMNQAQHESKLLWWYDLDLLPCDLTSPV